MKRRVYIAGPISKGDLHDNVKRASEAFLELMRAGFAPLCPHWSVYAAGPWGRNLRGEPWAYAEVLPAGTKHEDWLGVDLPWVAAADAVLRLPGESVGADAEVSVALQLGIPVFTSLTDLTHHFGSAAT